MNRQPWSPQSVSASLFVPFLFLIGTTGFGSLGCTEVSSSYESGELLLSESYDGAIPSEICNFVEPKDDDIEIQSTVETPTLWPEMTPCQFLRTVSLRSSTSDMTRFVVRSLFSRKTSIGTYSFARLRDAKNPNDEIWITFFGGVESDSVATTADVGISIGETVWLAAAPGSRECLEGALVVGSGEVLIDNSLQKLRTPMGVISADDTDVFIHECLGDKRAQAVWIEEQTQVSAFPESLDDSFIALDPIP
ncbi:MAG: hypothetical protein RBU37_23480 [Myxococcota bacterium]|jgi:hypothetical protein|nr:hypothetical protein [Myxococcota bacterium]